MALTGTIRIKSLSDTSTPTVVQKYVALSNGDNEIVAAVEGRQIQIIELVMATNLAGTFLLETGSDPIFPFMLSAGVGPFEMGSSPDRPLFAGNVGENMNININSSPTAAGIYLQYRYK